MQNNIPISKIERGTVVGKTIVKIGAIKSKEMVKRAFLSKENKEVAKNNSHEEIAKLIIDSLGQLKGISVKVAQQVALNFSFLPKEYIDEISKSFCSIPQINKALIRKIINYELGLYPNEIFDKFDNTAFGAASLGQVHLAEKKGMKLAVKVQYPGIEKSMDSDLDILKFCMKRFAKGKNIDPIIQELEDRLKEEVDYLREARNTEYFFNNLKLDNIVIPQINKNLSTKKVLSSTFLEGDSFNTFINKNQTQETKDYYAQLIFDSFFITLYDLKKIHADPNPGNFIFMDNKKLGLIDFGCVKEIDESFLIEFSYLHKILIEKASDLEITKQYAKIGMIDVAEEEKMINFYQNVIKPLDSIYIEVFENDTYDFKENNDFSKRGFNLVLEVQKKNKEAVHKMNPNYIFLDRTLLGYYAMFEKMEAKIDTRLAKKLIFERCI